MKQNIIFSISILIFTASYGQKPIPVDSIYNTIKQSSIHSKNADWANIEKGFTQKLQLAKNDLDSLESFVYVFKQLNDYHSGINYKGKYFSNFLSYSDSAYNYIGPLFTLSSKNIGVFKAELIDEKYLYIQVPGVQAMGTEISKFAQMLSDTLCKYVSQKTKGIVLDLRLNGGGQVSSMIAGIAPLLGNNYLGGGINSDAVKTMEFRIKDGNILLNNYQVTSITHKSKLKLEHTPVALIIGPTTASSGSILAVSFKGRRNTIFIGESTAYGYTTANDYFMFSNNLFLNLSTSYIVDKNNNVYTDVVKPDIIITGNDNFKEIKNDNKVKVALKWLRSKLR